MSHAPHPRIAAFFDIDGTLLEPPPLERRLVKYLAWRGEVSTIGWLRAAAVFLARAWRDPLAATDGNKAHYAGVHVSSVGAYCALFRRHPLALRPAAIARLQWHAAQSHRIVFVSGTLRPLAECVARVILPLLNSGGLATPVGVAATELESRSGRFTGRVTGPPMCGPAKAAAIRQMAAVQGIDLRRSFAYGDHYADRWMLESVGHPAAVHPCSRLSLLADLRGWPVLEWGAGNPQNPHPAAQHLHVSV